MTEELRWRENAEDGIERIGKGEIHTLKKEQRNSLVTSKE